MSTAFDPYLSWLGIRHPERPPNHYRLLGIELFEDDPEVVLNAADRQMAHVRTFQTGRHSAESQRVLNELAAAKICLLNPEKKARYDAEIRAVQEPAERPLETPNPPMPPPVSFPGVVEKTDFSANSGGAVGAFKWSVPQPIASDVEPPPDQPEEPSFERRPRLTPVIIGVLGVFVLLLFGLIGLIASRGAPGDKPADTAVVASRIAPEPSISSNADPVSIPTDIPDPSAPATKPRHQPRRQPSPQPKPQRVHKPAPQPAPEPEPKPHPKPSYLPPAAESIEAARTAMIARDLAAAEKHLALAAKAAYPKDRKEVERLQTILVYLEGFCDALRHGTALLKPDELLMVGDGLVKIVSVSGDVVVVEVDEQEKRYTVRTLPPRLALAIAGRALPDELPSSILSKAAFLTLDPAGDARLVRRLCGIAAQQGLPTDELHEELKLKRKNRPR